MFLKTPQYIALRKRELILQGELLRTSLRLKTGAIRRYYDIGLAGGALIKKIISSRK